MTTKRQEKKSGIERLCADSARAAYMIAWRDRHIEKQKEVIGAYEEKCTLLEALLSCALLEEAEEKEAQTRQAQILKASLAAALGKWQCRVENSAEAYVLTFVPQKEEDDAAAVAEE